MTERTERISMVTIAVVFTIAVAVSTFWGGGYFWIPLALVGLVVWGFYAVLSRAAFRNPLARHRPGLADRYADGQPLGRALTHEELCARDPEACREEEEEMTRDRYVGPREPPGVEGPPPQVPFP